MARLKLPRIDKGRYYSMNAIEFDEICEKLVRDNGEWIRENMPDPHTLWGIVVGTTFVELSTQSVLPSIAYVRSKAKPRKRAYLINRLEK